MLNIIRISVISFLGLTVLACSSSGGGTGGDGGTGPGSDGGGTANVTQFCNSVLSTAATLESTCVGGSASQWEALLDTSSTCTEFAAAVSAGRVTYNSAQAPACLSAYAALTCAELSGGSAPPSCAATLEGTVAKGGTCYAAQDCAGTSYCNLASGSCAGVCEPLIVAGLPCTGVGQCVSGCSCSGSGTSTVCTPDPATPVGAAEGATCGYDATTMRLVPCATGLTCSTMSVCTTPVKQGAACTAGANTCELFSYCDSKSLTCTPYPAAGGACGQTTGQDYISCAAGTFCQITGTGAMATGTCVTLGASGAACANGTNCVSGSCTMASGAPAGTCTAPCTQE